MQANVPQNGQRVGLLCGGQYIGKNKGKFEQVGLVPRLDSY